MTGLYVHIPFCIQKCKYCDFISFAHSEEAMEGYIDALLNEMNEYRGREVDTVFIGGGTPTCLSEELLEKLLKGIAEGFARAEECEFTMEANPETVHENKLNIMKRYGVNRVSIGVQSFCDVELAKIGRVHNAETVFKAIRLLRACGFRNINLDIMSALPGQTMESFQYVLQTAVEQNPEHISCYSLILEENTPLWLEYEQGLITLPEEETERQMYEFACRYLAQKGYIRYEISNFAKPGFESKHNMKYWQCREYIGVGLAAHSYYRGERYANTRELNRYLSGHYHERTGEKLTLSEQIEEFVIMGLRMDKGISKQEFYNRFGIEIEAVYEKELNRFLRMGLLERRDGAICLSQEGVSVSNSIMCEFVSCKL